MGVAKFDSKVNREYSPWCSFKTIYFYIDINKRNPFTKLVDKNKYIIIALWVAIVNFGLTLPFKRNK